ncbi:MAG: hypothetical protein FWC75_06275 [Oscillospiraceae bacterium]|nr:hypothetical protein [Oscillospiraceae bacterium]
MTKLPRSKLITKIIVFALVVYAGISLVTLRGHIEASSNEQHEVRLAVAEQEVINAQLEHDILHHNDSDVKANLARANLGLVLPGEIILFDAGSSLDSE